MNGQDANDRIDAVREELKDFIRFYDDMNLSSKQYHDCFVKTREILDRAYREFDARLFFVLMFGPLKAGKSTLTNLLARKYVSPTGFGMETTLRPSIILKSEDFDDYYIDVYKITNLRDNVNRKELFNQVIDVLRGIADESSLAPRISKERIKPLNEDNVKMQLTEELPVEPLITVLRVPGGELVTENIALIDMPGLDGVKSNWKFDAVHEQILNRADFLIFVQSSMAAINEATIEFLKKAYGSSKEPPLWLVQNIIDAKYWQSEEEKKAAASAQQKIAKEQIRQSLKLPESPTGTAINLGKAWDGIGQANERERELLAQSRFEGFERELKKTLTDNRILMQQMNSVKGVQKAISDCKEEFREYRRKLEALKSEYQKGKKELDEPKDELSHLKENLEDSNANTITQTLETRIRAARTGLSGGCAVGLDDLCESLHEGYSSKVEELYDRVEKEVGAVNDACSRILETFPYDELANAQIESWNRGHLDKINAWLADHDLEAYVTKADFAPRINRKEFRLEREDVMDQLKKAMYKLKKIRALRRPRAEYDSHMNEFRDWFSRKYREYENDFFESLKKQFLYEFGKWSKEGYYRNLAKSLHSALDARNSRLDDSIEELSACISYIDKLEERCGVLSNLCTDAVNALK